MVKGADGVGGEAAKMMAVMGQLMLGFPLGLDQARISEWANPWEAQAKNGLIDG